MTGVSHATDRAVADRQATLCLVAMALAAFASAVAMTSVAVAVPGIARAWSLGQDEVQWVASGFMAAMLPAMLATPRLIRHLGVRRTAVVALCALAAGGVASAGSPSFAGLLAARVVEGLAAGVLQPLPLLVVARTFDADRRGRSMGLVSMVVVLAPGLSPALGGLLADHLGWRAVLALAAPFALIAAVAAWRVLGSADTPPPTDPAVPPNSLSPNAPARPLLRNRRFRSACLAAFLYGMGSFAASYLTPVFVQVGLARSASAAGAVLLPGGLALALLTPWGGRMADRHARHRLVAAGLALFGLAHLPLLALDAQDSLLWLVPLLVASRAGLALALPSITLDALAGLDRADWPSATAWVSCVRQAGAAIGIAGVAALVDWRIVAEGSALPGFHQGFAAITLLCAAGAWVAWRNDTPPKDPP